MSVSNTLKFIVQHPLNRGRRAQALVGFLKWQVGSRLVPGQVVFNWVNGARVIARPGESGLTGNIYCGLHEFPDMAFLLHVLSSEDLFIDIGANVGSYTILACASKGAKGYCFEPVPATFERLMDNIRINNLAGHVEALNLGLSDKEGELVFTSGENSMNHVVADNEPSLEVVRVKVLPLDMILKDKSPSVLKIDVEGFETPVLNGAQATLSNESLHSVIMELNGCGSRYGFNEDDILRMMSSHGFSTYSYEPFSRKLTSLGGKKCLSGNTLFVRNEEVVRDKIAKSPKVLVGDVQL